MGGGGDDGVDGDDGDGGGECEGVAGEEVELVCADDGLCDLNGAVAYAVPVAIATVGTATRSEIPTKSLTKKAPLFLTADGSGHDGRAEPVSFVSDPSNTAFSFIPACKTTSRRDTGFEDFMISCDILLTQTHGALYCSTQHRCTTLESRIHTPCARIQKETTLQRSSTYAPVHESASKFVQLVCLFIVDTTLQLAVVGTVVVEWLRARCSNVL